MDVFRDSSLSFYCFKINIEVFFLLKYTKFALLGFPWDGGATLGPPGARFAPDKIRKEFNWITNRIVDNEIYNVEKRKVYNFKKLPIVDYGNVKVIGYSYKKTFKNAESLMLKALKNKSFPFIIGGDHSFSYPLIKAMHDNCNGQVGIIQFDAHLDLVDQNELQGRFSQSSQIRRSLELPRINEENIIQIGIRNYNYPWYDKYFSKSKIQQITAKEVWHGDVNQIVKKIIKIRNRVEKLYLTFDIDVLDPAFAPGSGGRESGGLMPMQCFEILDKLYPIIDAMDIAEVNPLYDTTGITISIASRIIMDCASTLSENNDV